MRTMPREQDHARRPRTAHWGREASPRNEPPASISIPLASWTPLMATAAGAIALLTFGACGGAAPSSPAPGTPSAPPGEPAQVEPGQGGLAKGRGAGAREPVAMDHE